MAFSISGGSLGRWFEQLCRIEFPRLGDSAAPSKSKLLPRSMPDHGGVYAFWWMTGPSLLRSRACNRTIVLKGPAGRHVPLVIDDEWLGTDTKLPIPMYVGKTASQY